MLIKLKKNFSGLLLLVIVLLLVSFGFALSASVADINDQFSEISAETDAFVEAYKNGGINFTASDSGHFLLISLEADSKGQIIELDGKACDGINTPDINIDDTKLVNGYVGVFNYNSDYYVGKTVYTTVNDKEVALILMKQSNSMFRTTLLISITFILAVFLALAICLILYSRYITWDKNSEYTHLLKLVIICVAFTLIVTISTRIMFILEGLRDIISTSVDIEGDLSYITYALGDQYSFSDKNIEDIINLYEDSVGCSIVVYDASPEHEAVDFHQNDFTNKLDFNEAMLETDNFNYFTKISRTNYFVHSFKSDNDYYISCIYDANKIYNHNNSLAKYNSLIAFFGFLLIVLIRQATFKKRLVINELLRNTSNETKEPGNKFMSLLGKIKKTIIDSIDFDNEWSKYTAEMKLAFVTKFAICYIVLALFNASYNHSFSDDSLIEIILSGNWQRNPNIINILIVIIGIIGIFIILNCLKSIVKIIIVPLGRKSETFVMMTMSIVQYILIFVGIFYGSYLLGMEIKSVTTAATVVAGIIGVGAQSILSDITSGILMMTDGMLAVGDVISCSGVKGVIKEIGIRSIVVENSDGSRTKLANSTLKNITIYSPNSDPANTAAPTPNTNGPEPMSGMGSMPPMGATSMGGMDPMGAMGAMGSMNALGGMNAGGPSGANGNPGGGPHKRNH